MNTYDEPREGIHTRYMLVTPDAPALATFHKMIEHHDDEEVQAIVLVTPDGHSELVIVDEQPDGTWIVVLAEDGRLVEQANYNDAGDPVMHETFVDGFTSDIVPIFVPQPQH